MASQRGYAIVNEYTDRISGAKTRRAGLDQRMSDARRGKFDVVLVWASYRLARSVKHFLDVLDEFNRLNIESLSFRSGRVKRCGLWHGQKQEIYHRQPRCGDTLSPRSWPHDAGRDLTQIEGSTR